MTDDDYEDGDFLAPEPLLVTIPQAARLCQVSPATIRAWSYEPGFPIIRRPHCVRIHARLLDAWLRSRSTLKESA